LSEVIVYIDRSNIRPGSIEPLKQGVEKLVEFIKAREPQLIAYGFHIDDRTQTMTVVAVHPDSASLELHLEVGGPEFRKLAGFIDLRSIEVYGRPSEKVRGALRGKADALGEGGTVVVRELRPGF
jgi:hypothetical protein